MNSDKKIDVTDTSGQASTAPKSNSRRRLLQAGIGASPVALSVMSQPVHAAFSTAVTCRSASAFASMNAAAATNTALSKEAVSAQCNGLTPAGWKTALLTNGDTTQNSATFPGSSTAFPGKYAITISGVLTDSPTLGQVLRNGSSGTERDTLALAIAAVYMNLLTPGYVVPPGLTVAQLTDMWTQTQSGGIYLVGGTTPWTTAQVIQYLSNTYAIIG